MISLGLKKGDTVLMVGVVSSQAISLWAAAASIGIGYSVSIGT